MADPQRWRDRAEKARLLAQDMKDPEAREAMLRVAKDYERLRGTAVEAHAKLASTRAIGWLIVFGKGAMSKLTFRPVSRTVRCSATDK
jgi:hypothetical protein